MKIKKITSLIIITMILYGITPLSAFAVKKNISSNEITGISLNIAWWQEFNDAILTDYIIKALHYNHDLKLETLKTKETIEYKNLQRANEFPHIGIGAIPALYKLPKLTNSEGFLSLPIYADYEADLFGKNRDKTKSYDKMIEISEFNEKAACLSVVSAVGSAYYNIVKLDKLIKLQEQIILDRKQIYDIMTISNEQGIVSTADTVSANKAYISANSELIELKKTRQKMLNMLAVLMGETPENTEELQRIIFDDLTMNKPIPECISSDVIQARPDYLTAEKMLEKTGLDIRAAKKEFLPSFNIFGLISFNTGNFISSLDWKNSVALLGGGILLPLFCGGSKIANLKLQQNKYNQAIENYKKTNLTAIQEVNDCLCNLKLDNEKYIKTLESYKAAEEEFYYTKLKYREGIISALDLLQKHESLLVTEKLIVTDKTDYFINQISLYKVSGGGVY